MPQDKHSTLVLRDAIRVALEDDHSLEDILIAIRNEYEGLQQEAEDNDENTDYWRLNAETMQDLIDSLP